MLASKEFHAAGLKRRLGITAWREFSEDMQQGAIETLESIALFYFYDFTPFLLHTDCSSLTSSLLIAFSLGDLLGR